MERIAKVLSQSNIASRRKAEEMIISKRVKVNGVIVTDLATKVRKNDEILVDDKPILKATLSYFLLNKPTGYVSSTSDEKNRKTVLELLTKEDQEQRVYPVGRLDYDTAGLLLLTNDGELTNILTHPKKEVEKEYQARVEGIVFRKTIIALKKGVIIDDNYLAIPKNVKLIELDKVRETTLLSITLTEGKNKQVRKMLKAIGHPVKKLTRVRYDFLTIDGIKRGSYRQLKVHEVKKLYLNR